MAMSINTNIAALNAQRNLGKTQGTLNQSLARLSSGLRINSAKDDAAGLAISNRMGSQIRGLNQAVRNANDGISMAQTAEGALQESTNLLQRMRELAIQSANASNSGDDRASLQAEVTQNIQELNRIANTTRFGTTTLLTGSFSQQFFQVGAKAHETIGLSITSARASDLGLTNNIAFTGFDSSNVSASAASPASGVTGQTLTFEVDGEATNVSVNAGDSALEIADYINSQVAGVTASATTGARIDASTGVEANDTITLTINGTTLAALATDDDATASASIANAIQNEAALSNLSVTDNADGTVDIRDTSGADISVVWVNGTDATSDNAVTVDDLDSAGTASGSAVSITDTQGVVVTGDIDFTTSQGDSTFALYSSDTSGKITTAGTSGAGGGALTESTDRISDVDISSVAGAQTAIDLIDFALTQIDDSRASLGAVQNRLETTMANLQSISENVSAARSRIMDADFAAETAEMTKAQVLQQAGVAMLAQANMLPQAVLSLLQ